MFATAFDQYAVKAFEVNAVDYILKPFEAQSIQKAWWCQAGDGRRAGGKIRDPGANAGVAEGDDRQDPD